MYCGENIWISRLTYNDIKVRANTNSMFVREMAEAICGAEELGETSMTGRPCNRTGAPAKNQLDSSQNLAIKGKYRSFMFFVLIKMQSKSRMCKLHENYGRE